jgi:TonB family protein
VVSVIVGTGLSLTTQLYAVELAAQASLPDPKGGRVERIVANSIYVSVDRDDVTLAKLVEQARELRAANASGWRGFIAFFTSRYAAQTFTMNDLVDPPPRYKESAREFLAFYEVETGREFLTVFPFGDYREFEVARVPIDGVRLPQCEFRLAARCLFRLDTMESAAGMTGTVTLEARATRKGKLERLRVVDSSSEQSKQDEQLARAALANAKSWWLDPSRSEQDVRITYVFGAATIVPNPVCRCRADAESSG